MMLWKKNSKKLHFILYIDWACKCPFAPLVPTLLLKIALLFLNLLSYFKIYLKLDFVQLFTSVTHKTINISSKSYPNGLKFNYNSSKMTICIDLEFVVTLLQRQNLASISITWTHKIQMYLLPFPPKTLLLWKKVSDRYNLIN